MVWIPRIPSWKGLLLRGILESPTTNPNYQLAISWIVELVFFMSNEIRTGKSGAREGKNHLALLMPCQFLSDAWHNMVIYQNLWMLFKIYIYIDVWHYPVLWEHVIRCISIMYNDMNISTLVAKEDLVNFHIMSSVSTVPKALCDFSYLTRSVSSAFFVPSLKTSGGSFNQNFRITFFKLGYYNKDAKICGNLLRDVFCNSDLLCIAWVGVL